MQLPTNLKHLYASLSEHLSLRRPSKSRKNRQRAPLQISPPFNFQKTTTTLPGLTSSEIFALREKAAASRIGVLPDHSHSPPSSLSPTRSRSPRSRCSSPGSPRSLRINTGDEDFFAAAPPPIPARSAARGGRAASLMVVREGGGGGVGAGWSTVSLPVGGGSGSGSGSGSSTPVDLDELVSCVGPVPVARGRGRGEVCLG